MASTRQGGDPIEAAMRKQRAEEAARKREQAARKREQAAIQAQNRSSGFPQDRFSGAWRQRGLRPNQRNEGGWGRMVEDAGNSLIRSFGGPRTDEPRRGTGWTYSGNQQGPDPRAPARQPAPAQQPAPARQPAPVAPRTPTPRSVSPPAPTMKSPVPAHLRGKQGVFANQGSPQADAPPVAPVFRNAAVPSNLQTQRPAGSIPAGLNPEMRRHAGFGDEPTLRPNTQAALIAALIPGNRGVSSSEKLRGLVQSLSEYRRGGRVGRRR